MDDRPVAVFTNSQSGLSGVIQQVRVQLLFKFLKLFHCVA